MRNFIFAAALGLLCSAFPQKAEIVRCASNDQPDHLKQHFRASTGIAGEQMHYASNNGTPITIKTYVHVITTGKKKSNYTVQMVLDQITVMNEGYNSSRIRFDFKGVDFHVNDTLAHSTATEEGELPFKQLYRKGSYQDLNIYFLSDYTGFFGGTILGRCPFPEEVLTDRQFYLDGCTLQAFTLPGAPDALEEYNEGKTAVHEIGHWFGLFHTFQGGDCYGEGDYVADTPAELTYNEGCPTKLRDTCPKQKGVDPIHNYMDYSTDVCLTEFTPLQTARMLTLYWDRRHGK